MSEPTEVRPIPTLSPDLLRTARFATVRRGYSPAEVDGLLEHVAQTIEEWLAAQTASSAQRMAEVADFARQAVEREQQRAAEEAQARIADATARQQRAAAHEGASAKERAALQAERQALRAELARVRWTSAEAEAARDKAQGETRGLEAAREELAAAVAAVEVEREQLRAEAERAARERDRMEQAAQRRVRQLREEAEHDLARRREEVASRLVARTARFLEGLELDELDEPDERDDVEVLDQRDGGQTGQVVPLERRAVTPGSSPLDTPAGAIDGDAHRGADHGTERPEEVHA